MKAHRYSNGRVGGRSSNGQFQKLTFRDVFGIDLNEREQECLDCGHKWTPLVISGKCHNAECGSTNTRTVPPSPEIQAKIDRYRQIQAENPDGIYPLNHKLIAEAATLFRSIQSWL